MGDYYAHESGLGLLGGLPILIGLFLAVYILERFDKLSHDAYYWLCIIIMRTGATNIADYSAGRRGLHIDRWVLSAGFGAALLGLALWAAYAEHKANGPDSRKTLPDTNPRYWVAMLIAGIFGTVLGDAVQGLIGQGTAAIVLSVVLAVALLIYRNGLIGAVLAYWLTVGVARTTGTAIGDWLAENKMLDIGLARCTLMTGVVFIAVVLLWRNRRPPVEATATA
jgi:uncharacterized membrane-anchored protein